MASLDCSMMFAMDDEEYGFYEDIDTDDDDNAPHRGASAVSSEDEASLTRCSSRIVDDNAASLLSSPPILSHRAVEAVSESLPWSLQDQDCPFERLFSTSRDGASFATFMRRVRGRDSTVIVVKTSSGRVIGGFAPRLWSGRGKQTSCLANQSFLFEVRRSKALSSTFIPGYEEFSSSPTSTLDFDFGNLSMQDVSPKVDVIRTPHYSRLEQVCHLTQKYLSLSDANHTLILEDSFARGMACIDGVKLETFTVIEFEVYGLSENY